MLATARDGADQSQELGIQSVSPMWVAVTQLLGESLLLPKVCLSGKRTGSEAG